MVTADRLVSPMAGGLAANTEKMMGNGSELLEKKRTKQKKPKKRRGRGDAFD